MLLLAPALLLAPLARAEEVVLRNDTAYDDGFGPGDHVAWLGYPECAGVVLDPPPEAYPLVLHTVQVFLGSSLGNQDHAITHLTMGIYVLEEGEAMRLPGWKEWAVPEAPFQVTVASDQLNALSLDDPEQGLYPLTVESGDVAIWVCAPDPDDSELPGQWPYADLATDTSGLVIDSDAPSGGSWVSDGDGVHALSELGAEGSWVIRAVSGYDVAVPLAVTAVSPATAELGRAAEVTVTGAGFDAATVATIGGLALSAAATVDADHLAGRSPSGLPVGVHDVMVTGADGASATLVKAFTVTEPADTDPPEDTDAPADTDVADTDGADTAADDRGTPATTGEGCGCAVAPTRLTAWLGLAALALAWQRRSTRA